MKKKLITALLCAALCCLLCVAACAADESSFDAEIRMETSKNGTVILTVNDSPILAEKAPKLKVPFTETANVHVFHDGEELEADADGSYVSFAVNAGGQYIIAADAAARIREVQPSCTRDGYYIYSVNGETYKESSGKYAYGHWFGKNEPTCRFCGVSNPHYVAPEEPQEGYAACPGGDACIVSSFTDVDADAWYHDGIHFCVEHGIMNGVNNTEFGITGDITRAQIVTMLWRLEGEPVVENEMSFEDVFEEQWYTEAVRWAASEKIVNGYDDAHFGTNDPVTREQLATILYRYAQYKGQGFQGSWMFLLEYVDRADISEWADEAVHWCSMKGIVEGKTGDVFDPQGTATRAEAACMMQRFCEALKQ